MEKIDRLLTFISSKTGGEYAFLRLKAISFSKKDNTLHVFFIFPNDRELSSSDKEIVTACVKEYVNLHLDYDVTFTRSFVEHDLITKHLCEFLDKNNHMLFIQINMSAVSIDIDGYNVSINFPLEEPLADYFTKNKIAMCLREYLSRNFTANFDISVTTLTAKAPKKAMLEERFVAVKKKSELDVILSASRDKYIVDDKKVLVGGEISLSPRYINSIDRTYEDCVVAGTILNISEKNYTKTRKDKKTGEDKDVSKPFFRFQIKDNTGTIHVVLFPSKVKYHKMNLIKNGDTVIVEGKITKYLDSFEMTAKNISLCSIPSKTLYDVYAEKGSVSRYRFVSPQPFTSMRQAGIFENRRLSRELEQGTFVVYDFETTGVDTKNDEIVEIGALKIVCGKFTEVFTTLVKPSQPIPKEATKINKITNDMVKYSYSIEQVLRDFYTFCQGSTLVGYNSIAFDRQFLSKEARKAGLSFDNNEIDVYLLVKQKLTSLKTYRLSSVCSYMDIPLNGAHRALNDVIATAELFLKLY